MNKTNQIFFGIVSVMMLVLGFFSGAITEQYTHVQERDQLIFERDSIEAVADHYRWNVDWNALKNIRVAEVTENCKRCNPMVSTEFNQLDTKEVQAGRLVVPSRNNRNLSDR